MMRGATFILLLMLAACDAGDAPQQAEPAPFTLADALGGTDTAGFLRAEAPRAFRFPEDHGPHPGFRNEWWYFTGNLQTAEGRHFGYQLTFFNAALRGDAASQAVGDASAWHSPRIWMAHFAVTDVDGARHYARERFSRENPGLAGATGAPLRVWLEDWRFDGAQADNWQLRASDGDIALSLDLTPAKPPVLQGIDGLSRKSPDAGNASYYYSVTRIATQGTLRVGTETFAVSGASWLDREWSTSALGADQGGWDWFSLQFDDGQELMYYQLRTAAGTTHPNSQGNWTDAAARQTLIEPEALTLSELDTWVSPTGISYTTTWSLQYAGRTWRIEALLDEQWMNLTIPYWEGAVRVLDETGEREGQGYLEMVRN